MSHVAEKWPENLALTEENLRLMAETHDLYVVENSYALPIPEDPDIDEWSFHGSAANNRAKLRDQIRETCSAVPTAIRVLNLYKYYTLGSGVEVSVQPTDPEAPPVNQKTKRATAKIRSKLRKVSKHLSFPEMGRRLYRDGELFIRRIKTEVGYDYRFVDPENICDKDGNELAGIVTDPDDTVNVLGYILSRQTYDQAGNPVGYEEYARVEPEDMLYMAIDKDSTIKRSLGRMPACMDAIRKYRNLLLNEVTLRSRQSAIVMIRKVAGGASAARSILDAAKTATSQPDDSYSGQERYRAGTVATTSKGVEISFAHPDNNFSDAGPLFHLLDREVAKVTGFTFEQISCDHSTGNLASAIAADSPTHQMLLEERAFLSAGLEQLFMWFLDGDELGDSYQVVVQYPKIVTTDALKEAQTGNLGVMANAISRKELARRLNADPEKMRAEIEEESKLDYINPNYGNQNPNAADKAVSSAGNAAAGGTNQGDKPAGGSQDMNKQGSQK